MTEDELWEAMRPRIEALLDERATNFAMSAASAMSSYSLADRLAEIYNGKSNG